MISLSIYTESVNEIDDSIYSSFMQMPILNMDRHLQL